MLQKNSVFILLKQLKHNLLMEILQSQFENGTLKFSFTQKMYSPSLQFVIWKAVLAGVFCFVIFFMATGAAVCAAVHTSTDHWFRADPFLLLNLGYLSWHLTSNQIVCWYISIYFWRFNALYEKTKDQFYSAYLTLSDMTRYHLVMQNVYSTYLLQFPMIYGYLPNEKIRNQSRMELVFELVIQWLWREPPAAFPKLHWRTLKKQYDTKSNQ